MRGDSKEEGRRYGANTGKSVSAQFERRMIIYSIPDPNAVFPNAYGTTCFLKKCHQAPNILVGDYTYYDDPVDPTRFEQNNVFVQLAGIRRPTVDWKILLDCKRCAVHYEHSQPSHQQRHDLSLPRVWRGLGGTYPAAFGTASL